MDLPARPKKEVRKDAKLVKAFGVLIKKKLNRDHLCRGRVFRKLMALVFDPLETKDFRENQH